MCVSEGGKNRSNNGLLSFPELSHMLWTLRHDISLRKSRAEAVDTMLLLDNDSGRCVIQILHSDQI